MTKTLPFTEQAIRRAVSAARKAGVTVGSIEIRPDGTIVIFDKEHGPKLAPDDDDKWSDLKV